MQQEGRKRACKYSLAYGELGCTRIRAPCMTSCCTNVPGGHHDAVVYYYFPFPVLISVRRRTVHSSGEDAPVRPFSLALAEIDRESVELHARIAVGPFFFKKKIEFEKRKHTFANGRTVPKRKKKDAERPLLTKRMTLIPCARRAGRSEH